MRDTLPACRANLIASAILSSSKVRGQPGLSSSCSPSSPILFVMAILGLTLTAGLDDLDMLHD